jgi:hypothetical protein
VTDLRAGGPTGRRTATEGARVIVGEVGPAFPIRGLLLAMGYAPTTDADLPAEAGRFDLGASGDVEALWRELEPLVLTLASAGYEVREVVVGQAERGTVTDGSLHLEPIVPSVWHVSGDWPAATGVTLGADWFTAVLVRVTPRRTYGEPSPYPAVPLSTVTAFRPHRVPVEQDPFSNPADGWIVLTTDDPLDTPVEVVTAGAAAARDAVVDTLATAWEAGTALAVGLLWTLDPGPWDAVHEASAPLTQFRALAADIWAYLRRPGGMRAFLASAPDDVDATMTLLLVASGSTVTLDTVLEELLDRRMLLHPRNAGLATLLAGLHVRHWVTALLLIQEYGLAQVLPFPLELEVGMATADLTGWYDSLPGQPRRSMQLNQAADQLDGWWLDEELNRYGIDALSGPFGTDPGVLGFDLMFTDADGRSEDAALRGVPMTDDPSLDTVVEVTFRDETLSLRRRDRLARLASALQLRDGSVEARAIAEALLVGLHPDLEEAMAQAIGTLLAQIRRVTAVDESRWFIEIDTLEGAFRTALADQAVYAYEPTRIPQTPMLLRLRADVRRVLLGDQIGGRSAWEQLIWIITVADSSVAGSGTSAAAMTLRALLDISTGAHLYTFQFTGTGAVADVEVVAGGSAGGMAIAGPIDHLDTCPSREHDQEPEWSHVYAGALLQAGVGLGAGAMVTVIDVNLTSNDLTAETEWRPNDFSPPFPGPLLPTTFFAQGTLSLGLQGAYYVGGGGGYEWWEGYTFITRSLWSVATGSGDGWFATAGGGFGGEVVSLDGALGYLRFRLTSADQASEPLTSPSVITAVEGIGDAGFATGSAVLSAAGRRSLAAQFARYRALLESPGSVLVIEGDASPAGPEAFNETLSWRRAVAVYTWLRNALTSPTTAGHGTVCALAVTEGRTQLLGNGEMQARFAGISDGVDAAQWRNAKIMVNNSELLLL